MAALLLAILPTSWVRPIVNAMGHRIFPGARIGFSIVLTRRLVMAPNTRIGHGNFVDCTRLLMRSGAGIGVLNFCRGPCSIWLSENARLGRQNTITRGRKGVTYGPAQLRLGTLSKLTAGHKVDCTASVILGDYTTVAGCGSQIWTHGYVHAASGPGRYRVDGPITLGNNVYIGSRANITGGVNVADGVIVGVGVTVSRNLHESGMYVSAPLRVLPRPRDPSQREDMNQVIGPGLLDTVYRKKDGSQ